jgi:hypothetical protein
MYKDFPWFEALFSSERAEAGMNGYEDGQGLE